MRLAERDRFEAVLEAGGEHDAAHDGGQQQQQRVHDPGHHGVECRPQYSVQGRDSPGGHAGVAGAGAALADGARGGPEAAGGGAAQGDDGAHHEADQELGGQQQAKSDMK